MKQIQVQPVGVNGSSKQIAALNRLYSNPTTAQTVQRQVLKVYQQTPSPLANSRYTTSQVGGQYRSYAVPSLVRASSGVSPASIVTSQYSPVAVRGSQVRTQAARYGSSFGGVGSPLAALGDAAFRQAVLQKRDRELGIVTPSPYEGRAQLLNDFSNRYPGFIAFDPQVEEFSRLRAQEAYNDRLQKEIDAYQSKPENRRKLYDEGVANGSIKPPVGYKSEELDRIRQKYGDERTVGDVKPYDDLTPDYSKLKPDIVYHPDGTITYEKPDPNSSNIPLVLGGDANGAPIDFTKPDTNNQFSAKVRIRFRSPNNHNDWVTQDVTSFSVKQYPAGTGITWDNNQDGPLADLSTLTVEPINGSSTVPTNRPSPSPSPIPTKPDGTADLAPFKPALEKPIPQRAPTRAPQAAPPPTAPLGKLDSPQLRQPEKSPFPSPTPSGQPEPFPPNPLPLAPRVPSKGVGEANPVKAISINATAETMPAPMVSVPTTGNPTKTTTDTAIKAQEQLGTKTQTQTATKTQTKPKQCEDPCIQGLHDKLDNQSNLETIEFNIFKECDKDTKEAVYTTASLSVPKMAAAILKAALNRIAESQGEQCKKDDCECYAAIPDWWQIRLGADIPQAVVQYAEIKDNNKFGSPMYAVSIPYYYKSKEATQASDFPVYTKGQRMGILTLRDNSKLIVNASEEDVEKVIKQLQTLIAPLHLIDSVYSDGKRKGKALKTIRVAPRIVKFFPTGQLDLKPQWIKYF